MGVPLQTEVQSQIVIPSIDLGRVIVSIIGLTPLITNRFSEEAARNIEQSQQRQAKVAKAPRKPEDEFQNAIHNYPNAPKGVVAGFPAVAVKKALVAAGGRFADEKMTILRGSIQIIGDLLPIYGSKPVMRRDRVVIKRGPTSLAYRPMFEDWKIPIEVSFNKAKLGLEQVMNLFNITGFAVGLGCWRPENDGIFGQFRVENAKHLPNLVR